MLLFIVHICFPVPVHTDCEIEQHNAYLEERAEALNNVRYIFFNFFITITCNRNTFM